jgi:UDP-N-acetylglucosamine acyltransferase
VVLGEDCVIGSNAVVLGPSRLGKRCRVHAFAVVGDEPQDRSWHGEESRLEVGDDVVVREHVTLHRGTAKGGGVTRVGSRCLLMVGVHVAHDCVVGDDVQLANLTTLGGHVVLGDHVVCGGHVAFAPFVRVGRGAYLAGGAMVERDVPPFMITAGDRARVRAPNRIGLERLGLSEESQRALVDTFRLTYGSGAPLVQGIAKARALYGSDPHVQELLAFIEPAGD